MNVSRSFVKVSNKRTPAISNWFSTEATFLLNATFNRYDEDACHTELLMLTLSFHSDQLQYLEMFLVSDWKNFGVNDIIDQPHCTRRYESVSPKCILNACYFIRGSSSYVISKNKNKKNEPVTHESEDSLEKHWYYSVTAGYTVKFTAGKSFTRSF